MKLFKTIIVGMLIWGLGVCVYLASSFLTILEDSELLGNLALAIALIPVVWVGTHLYFKWNAYKNGVLVGSILVLTAILLDALITVPTFIIPEGGSYQAFFGAIAFWLIVLEYFLVVFTYWVLNVKLKQS